MSAFNEIISIVSTEVGILATVIGAVWWLYKAIKKSTEESVVKHTEHIEESINKDIKTITQTLQKLESEVMKNQAMVTQHILSDYFRRTEKKDFGDLTPDEVLELGKEAMKLGVNGSIRRAVMRLEKSLEAGEGR